MSDTELLDWLQAQARISSSGISLDFVPKSEPDPQGWRFMRRFFISPPCKDIRAAIRYGMDAEKREWGVL